MIRWSFDKSQSNIFVDRNSCFFCKLQWPSRKAKVDCNMETLDNCINLDVLSRSKVMGKGSLETLELGLE